MMNVHHLELFYFVAKHGGIAGAVRNIPYGIQQPAVSAQIARLEESLGVKLFNRRPFSLSPAGTELYRFIEPFFSNIRPVSERIRGAASPQLRIAAPPVVLHDYIPAILSRLREKFPAFRLHLYEASQSQSEKMLLEQEIDISVTTLERKPRPGLRSQPLIELPLVLLVPRKHPLTRADQLWRRDLIEEPLITLPPTELINIHFQRGLKELDVVWAGSIEVNSLALIERYAASGFGIGLSVAAPGAGPLDDLRRIPLDGFPSITVGALWGGKLTSLARQFLTEVESLAASIKKIAPRPRRSID